MNMILFLSIFLIISIVIGVILIAIESVFIKNNKVTWLLPLIATCIAVVLIISSGSIVEYSGGIHAIGGANDTSFRYIKDNDGKTVAIGQLIVRHEDEDTYLDLEFKDGSLVGCDEALQYKDFLEKDLRRVTKDFSGKSVSYEELLRIEKSRANDNTNNNFDSGTALRSTPMYCIVPIILWAMFAIDLRKRKKIREANKMRINDL